MNKLPDSKHSPQPFSLAKRAESFVYAFRGIATLIRGEHNTWIHLLATILVLGFGLFYQLATHDWAVLLLAVALVWVAEAMNTAVEYLANAVSEKFNDNIMRAKDVAAAAVLIAAMIAVVIGGLVFYPYVLSAY